MSNSDYKSPESSLDHKSPEGLFADNEREGSKSSKSSSLSSSSSKNKEQQLLKIIKEKKDKGKVFSKETRQLAVIKHFENIRAEQKDYKFTIKEADNSDAIYEKILKLENDAENYSEKFIAGKIPEDIFRDKSRKTIDNLKEFLSSLPKFISLDKATKALLKKEKKTVKKIKDLTGASPPKIPTIVPKMVSPTELLKKPTEDDKPTIIDSIIQKKAKKQTQPITLQERPKLKIKNIKKRTYKTQPRKARRSGIKVPSAKKLSNKEVSQKKSPDKGFEWKPEYEMPTLIKKYKIRKNEDSPGFLKPQRNLENMSNTEIIKIFNSIPELKWPKKIDTKQEGTYARKELKKYFKEQSPGRRLTLKTTTTIPAQWHPPMSTEGLTANNTKRFRKDNIVAKRTTKQIRLRKKTKPITKPIKAKDRRKPIQTNIVFDPQNPQYWKIKDKKIKGRSPKLNEIYKIGSEKKLFDPRPSWDYKPKIHNRTYENFKNKLLTLLEDSTKGNQFRLAQLINTAHRELQINRAKLDAVLPPRDFKPLDIKFQKWLKTLKKNTALSTLPQTQKPLLIKLQGQIRPKKTKAKLDSKTKKGKYYKESPKKPTNVVFKKIPVDVLKAPIPPHYSRVEKMLLPPSTKDGKDEIRKKRKYITKEVVLRTPNWDEIEATGPIEKTGSITYKNVTREDLEDYLGRTYLLGYDNHFKGGDIKIRDEDRKYAYERAIDLRRCRGTVLESGAVVITRTELEKTNVKKVVAQDLKKQEKAIEKAYDLSRRIHNIYQKHKPKTTLIRKGKNMVAHYTTHLTEEQYKEALKGKVFDGLPMTSEQIAKIIKKLQEPLKELIAIQAVTQDRETVDKIDSHINQVTKFIENIKAGAIAKGVAPIKRKAPKKKKGVSIFLRSKNKQRGSSSSSDAAVPDDKKSPSSSKKSSSSSDTLSDLALEMEAEMKKRSPENKREKGQTIQEFLEEVRQEEEEKRALRAAGVEIPRDFPPPLDLSRPIPI